MVHHHFPHNDNGCPVYPILWCQSRWLWILSWAVYVKKKWGIDGSTPIQLPCISGQTHLISFGCCDGPWNSMPSVSCSKIAWDGMDSKIRQGHMFIYPSGSISSHHNMVIACLSFFVMFILKWIWIRNLKIPQACHHDMTRTCGPRGMSWIRHSKLRQKMMLYMLWGPPVL